MKSPRCQGKRVTAQEGRCFPGAADAERSTERVGDGLGPAAWEVREAFPTSRTGTTDSVTALTVNLSPQSIPAGTGDLGDTSHPNLT